MTARQDVFQGGAAWFCCWARSAIYLAAAALFAAATSAAHAQTVKIVYTASLFNVVALGDAHVEATFTPRAYAARTGMRTGGFARLFDDTEISATSSGTVSGGALGWRLYGLEHSFARKFRRISMSRSAQAVSAAITPRFSDMGVPPATPAEQLASHDPLTAFVAMARAIGVQGACAGMFRVFDGRQHYRLTLSPKALGRYVGGGYDGAALVCALRYTPVSGFGRRTPEDNARIPEGEIWFASPATDGFAAPLRIAAPTPAGELRIDMTSISVAP
ncbi:MAG: hypothetical protein FD124_1623 [Alphaproteobacteria bacterium]|nr:MAG: hypothetical protein FD160_1511 [Caulobacteraceae bacterium]TPW06623.1 MAG: hypothetical protein FD124_1623 [Alphaproteobacteria bacterium]